jgi:nucleotide-binding universal stress UspA family protein
MLTIKNILLTTDFSKLSLTAAKYAVDLSLQYNAKLHLLYVLEKTPPILAIHSLDLSEEKIVKTIEDEAKKSMQETVGKVKKEAGNNKIEIESVITKGIDYQEITKYAENNKIDVIVIATHGTTGILHTLLGSVAEKVIRYSKCPVLVITPSEKEK